mmetsp:Transcript_37358/g.101155  ORF Transcript_37358/g.101155 Transcript_37358/m.101155 type:complete len:119 (-) Transcript_37358:936-1292(-)
MAQYHDEVDDQIAQWEKANKSGGSGGGGGGSVSLPSLVSGNPEANKSADMNWPGGPLLVDPSVDDAIKAWEDAMNAKKKTSSSAAAEVRPFVESPAALHIHAPAAAVDCAPRPQPPHP